MSKAAITINGRIFNWPMRTLVVICLDGSEPAYTDEARKRGLMPNLEKLIAKGGEYRADSVIPSFTNPNNLSIVTGRPPEVHGICGNYLIDPETGLETMMNDPKWLRAPTVFAEFQKAGARILMVTAKDKLRLLLSKGLVFDGSAIAFSSEKAHLATTSSNGITDPCTAWGIALPDVYSGALSEFVFKNLLQVGVRRIFRDAFDGFTRAFRQALDVDFPVRELGCQPGVLAVAADGEGQLVLRHNDCGVAHFQSAFLQIHGAHASRAECLAYKHRCI